MAKDGGDWIASWTLHIHEVATGALHQVLFPVFALLFFWRGMKEILCNRIWGLESPLERPHPLKTIHCYPYKGWMVYANDKKTLRAKKKKKRKVFTKCSMSSGALSFALCPSLWHLHACKQWKVSGKRGCPVWAGGGWRIWSEWMHFPCEFLHLHICNLHEQFQEQEDTVSLLLLMKVSGSGYFPRWIFPVNLQQGGADLGTLWAQGRRWWERQNPGVWGGPHSSAFVSFRLPLAAASSEIGIFFSWKLPVSLPSHNAKKSH